MAQSNIVRSLSCFLLIPLTIAACSGADSGSGQSLIDSCSGKYVCVVAGDVVDSALTKTATGRCYLGNLELVDDGTSIAGDGSRYTWSGNAARLEICQGTQCFSCYP